MILGKWQLAQGPLTGRVDICQLKTLAFDQLWYTVHLGPWKVCGKLTGPLSQSNVGKWEHRWHTVAQELTVMSAVFRSSDQVLLF